MGVNQQAMSPQQMQMLQQYQNAQALRQNAVTPVNSGSVPGAGAANGFASLAKALMANQASKNWQKKWGVAPPQAPGAPGSTAASGASGASDLSPQSTAGSPTTSDEM